MVKDHSDSERGNMGYSFRLAARVLLYAPSHRQDTHTNTHYIYIYASRKMPAQGGGGVQLLIIVYRVML